MGTSTIYTVNKKVDIICKMIPTLCFFKKMAYIYMCIYLIDINTCNNKIDE